MEEKLFDGRWKLFKQTSHKVILINVYNGNTMAISYFQYKRICNGEDSVSHIITRKIPPDKSDVPVDNSVVKKYKRVKYKYANNR